jgi:hypothetical protein
MQKIGLVMGVIAVLQGACGDDSGNRGGGVVPIDAPAGGTTVSVTLTPGAEVPVCAAAGINATGAATISIAADGSSVTVDELTYRSLSGPATAAHIHAGAPGVAGPIVFPLALPTPTGQVFTAANYPSPAPPGAPADYASFIQAMRDGNSYVNVHTSMCPSGEIRAQL